MKYIVLEGDWGGQIYLTAPEHLVDRSKEKELLRAMDRIAWACNEGDGAQVSVVDDATAMGSVTLIPSSIWVNLEFDDKWEVLDLINAFMKTPGRTLIEFG